MNDAREFVRSLYLTGDIRQTDMANKIIDALDFEEELNITEIDDILDFSVKDVKGDRANKIEWLADRADLLTKIEETILDKCPEYRNVDIDDAIKDMLTRLRPKLEYDL